MSQTVSLFFLSFFHISVCTGCSVIAQDQRPAKANLRNSKHWHSVSVCVCVFLSVFLCPCGQQSLCWPLSPNPHGQRVRGEGMLKCFEWWCGMLKSSLCVCACVHGGKWGGQSKGERGLLPGLGSGMRDWTRGGEREEEKKKKAPKPAFLTSKGRQWLLTGLATPYVCVCVWCHFTHRTRPDGKQRRGRSALTNF